MGRADDCADESIAFSRTAEGAVLNVIGKMPKISPVTVQVALKDRSEAEKFTFSRIWRPPERCSNWPLAILHFST